VRDVVASTEPRPHWVVIGAEPITDIDTTAADMLVKLDEELNADGRHLVFAELKDPVRDKLARYSIYETIDPAHFYPTIRKAVEAYVNEHPESPVEAVAESAPR
jgi:MFS superfamily sulfate permease-like transporter